MTYLTTNIINDMNCMFNRLFTNPHTRTNRGFAADILETADGYRIEAELPGFTHKDVEIRIKDKLLVIEAQVIGEDDSAASDDENLTWFTRERVQGNRQRSFVLPEDADTETLNAELKNGCLTVNLSKKPEARPLTFKVHG